jgi:hypothetical protein
MTDNEINIVNSILEVKASGSDSALNDLNLPEGKSIAELLDDQEKDTK